ncbi:MAG: HD domain-containing protein [Prevotella sp.]|nr:HD domain-containing protein [Prevotella sp.]
MAHHDAFHPSLDLEQFIEQQILPRYQQFDRAHGTQHVVSVIRRSMALARQLGADADMAYTVAAYHDLGLEGPRAIHHLTSGRILAADQRLRRWFTPEQIQVMVQAVEDHRASAAKAPRSLYGKIVAEADRDLNPDVVVRRTVQFGLAHYPELNKEQQWERFCQHMDEKYSAKGYIRLWLTPSDNERHLKALREMIACKPKLRQAFNKAYAEANTTDTQNIKNSL